MIIIRFKFNMKICILTWRFPIYFRIVHIGIQKLNRTLLLRVFLTQLILMLIFQLSALLNNQSRINRGYISRIVCPVFVQPIFVQLFSSNPFCPILLDLCMYPKWDTILVTVMTSHSVMYVINVMNACFYWSC